MRILNWAIRGAQARTSREFGKEEVRERNVDNPASLRQSPALNFYPYLTMPLSAQIVEDMKTAMKAKDTVALNVVRGLKSAIKYAAIEKFGAEGELDDTDAILVVRKEIKKRQDSVASYESAARQDLADVEKAEIAVLEKYLPAAMSAEDLVKLVEAVIAELGATSKKEMGSVMKVLQERAEGRADNRALSSEVAKRLP
jgi:uncharacterized protein YqeY